MIKKEFASVSHAVQKALVKLRQEYEKEEKA
jgi:Arc/MetJ-type ribon-helix-helix transcriptional regulator